MRQWFSRLFSIDVLALVVSIVSATYSGFIYHDIEKKNQAADRTLIYAADPAEDKKSITIKPADEDQQLIEARIYLLGNNQSSHIEITNTSNKLELNSIKYAIVSQIEARKKFANSTNLPPKVQSNVINLNNAVNSELGVVVQSEYIAKNEKLFDIAFYRIKYSYSDSAKDFDIKLVGLFPGAHFKNISEAAKVFNFSVPIETQLHKVF